MVRTQIQLTEEQARKLRIRARQSGVSLAELIRGFVARGLAEEGVDRSRLYEKAAGLLGRFPDRDAASDLAREHDRYIDESGR